MSEIMKRDFTLNELVEYKKTLEKEMTEKGETMPDEVVELAEVANMLLAGRVDQACRFKSALEAHSAALTLQQENISRMLDMTEKMMKEAVVMSGKGRLDGSAYSMRVQNNSRASTIIEDVTKIPLEMHMMNVSMAQRYDVSEYLFWAGVLLKKVVEKVEDLTDEDKTILADKLKVAPSKSAVEAALKKDPASVPGARLERGTHLRVEAGKAKTKALEEKTGV